MSCRSSLREAVAAPLSGQLALVLAHLVIARPRVVSSDALEFALWGDNAPATARTGLHVVVNRLRKRLGNDSISSTPSGYIIDLQPTEIDVAAFEEAVVAAESADHARDYAVASDRSTGALELWRGEPFGQWCDRDDLRPAAERLKDMRARAAEIEAQSLIELGAIDRAIIRTADLTAVEPYRERGWRLRMIALYRAGRSVDALAVYSTFRDRLADDLGLSPSPDLDQLEHAILQHDATVVGGVEPDDGQNLWNPSVGMQPFSNGTPRRDATWFVGRDAELRMLDEAAQRHAVVCVSGPPGVGKTRLVSEFVRRRSNGVAHVWVDLAYEPEERVEARLAELLGVVDGELGVSIVDAAARFSADGPAVIVLDNCEHVIDATRSLLNKLSPVPNLVAIVTSRSATEHHDEMLLRLGPLGSDESVELLMDRVDAEVDLSGQDATLIAGLCDYLPLAIELVAHQLSGTSLEVVAQGMDQSNRSLRVGRESLDDRLRASIGLVDYGAARVLHALAPISGPFDALAAGALAEMQPDEVRTGLDDLVSHSLLSIERRPDSDVYWMLDTVRRNIVDDARHRGAFEDLQRSHIEHYANRALRYGAEMRSNKELQATARFRFIGPQLRAAWDACLEHGDADRAADLVVGVGEWALYRLRWHQLSWGPDLVEADLPMDSVKRVGVLAQAAGAEWARGHAQQAIVYGEKAISEANGLNQDVPLVTHFALLSAFGQIGEYQASHHHLKTAEQRAIDEADPYFLVGALSGRSMALTLFGEFEEAAARSSEAERVAESLGNQSATAWALYARALCHTECAPAKAIDGMSLSAEQAERVSNRLIQGLALTGAANCLRRVGNHREAAEILIGLLDHWEQAQVGPQIAHLVGESAVLLDSCGKADRGARLLAIIDNGVAPHPHLRSDTERLARLRGQRSLGSSASNRPLLDLVRDELEAI